ncbi:MAG: DUF4364 family protein [Clostridia bacterium]|nr:DUF4364 family protein [Clostridia bacterium]
MRLEPPRRAPDNEQKLIVLCCLNNLGPCTELQLLQFLFEYDLMNYFEMMFALNDLCDRGQAARTKKGAGYSYTVTAAGKEALELFGGRVLPSVYDLLERTGAEWRQRFRREAQNVSQITQTDRGEYELTLRVVEQDMDMMTLTVSLPSREMAQQLSDKWPRKAAKIYAEVFRTLTEPER